MRAGRCIISAAKDLKKKKKERKDSRSQATLGRLKLQLVATNWQGTWWAFLFDMDWNANQAKNCCILKGGSWPKVFSVPRDGCSSPGCSWPRHWGVWRIHHVFFPYFFPCFSDSSIAFPWSSSTFASLTILDNQWHRKRSLPKKRTRRRRSAVRGNSYSYNFG